MPRAGDLRQAEGHVHVAVVLEEQVGKIIGSEGVVRLNGERLLIGGLRLLPIALGFVKRAERNNDLRIGWGQRNGAFVAGDRGVDFATAGLQSCESGDRTGIGRSKFCGAGERLLRIRLAENCASCA